MGQPNSSNHGRPSCGWKPSCQAVHCVADQVVTSTIRKTTRIWPQRILVADIAGSFLREEWWSQAEPPLAAKAPADAAVAAREAGDMARSEELTAELQSPLHI